MEYRFGGRWHREGHQDAGGRAAPAPREALALHLPAHRWLLGAVVHVGPAEVYEGPRQDEVLRAGAGAEHVEGGGADGTLPQAGDGPPGEVLRHVVKAAVSAGLRRHAAAHQRGVHAPQRGGAGHPAPPDRRPRKRRVHHLRPRPQRAGHLVPVCGSAGSGGGARVLLQGARGGRVDQPLRGAGRAGGLEADDAAHPGDLHRGHRRQQHRGQGLRAGVALRAGGPGPGAVAGQGAAGPPGGRACQRTRRGHLWPGNRGGEAAGGIQGRHGGGHHERCRPQRARPRLGAVHRGRPQR
mmetsp:Transcript_14697/g.44372  ORF Transcript_14697/g.44372 Transcript_14697/m.44372 type:complete len:296 (+) Transcript_14697:1764-2651(+)